MNKLNSLISSVFFTVSMAQVTAAEHRWNQTELGPTFSASLKPSGKGERWEQPQGYCCQGWRKRQCRCGVYTELLRVVSGWTEGFIRVNPGRNALLDHHSARGVGQFVTKRSPGWTYNGQWMSHPKNRGPMPSHQGRYGGLYMHEERVVFSYTVGEAKVLDSPWLIEKNGLSIFTVVSKLIKVFLVKVWRLLRAFGQTGVKESWWS